MNLIKYCFRKDIYQKVQTLCRTLLEDIDVPMLLWAGGAMPKGADALLFPWQDLLQPHDQLVFTCEADRAIWHHLTEQSQLGEWVVPLPVDQTTFHPQHDRNPFRSKLGIPHNVPLLLYVGRLNIQKNIHSLLHTLVSVREKYPETVLCLVGEEDDIMLGEFEVPNTGYVKELHRLAQTLNIQVDAVLSKNGIRVGSKSAAQHVIQCLEDKRYLTQLSQAAHTFATKHFTCDQYAQRLRVVVEEALTHTEPKEPRTYTENAQHHRQSSRPIHQKSNALITLVFFRGLRTLGHQSFGMHRGHS